MWRFPCSCRRSFFNSLIAPNEGLMLETSVWKDRQFDDSSSGISRRLARIEQYARKSCHCMKVALWNYFLVIPLTHTILRILQTYVLPLFCSQLLCCLGILLQDYFWLVFWILYGSKASNYWPRRSVWIQESQSIWKKLTGAELVNGIGKISIATRW